MALEEFENLYTALRSALKWKISFALVRKLIFNYIY